jgi:hypothetical protein
MIARDSERAESHRQTGQIANAPPLKSFDQKKRAKQYQIRRQK